MLTSQVPYISCGTLIPCITLQLRIKLVLILISTCVCEDAFQEETESPVVQSKELLICLFILVLGRLSGGLAIGLVGGNPNPGSLYLLFPILVRGLVSMLAALVATGGPLCSELHSLSTAPRKAALVEGALLSREEERF